MNLKRLNSWFDTAATHLTTSPDVSVALPFKEPPINFASPPFPGTISQTQLSAQTILFNTETMLYMLVPMGFGMATNVRVGQYLGAGVAIGPKSVLSVALVTAWFLTAMFATGVILLRWQIPNAFTSDSEVSNLVAHLLPIIAAFQIFDGTSGVCSGAIRGAGLWIGFTVGTVSQAIVYCAICSCIDWKKQVKLARERTRDVRLAIKDETTVDDYISANSMSDHHDENMCSTIGLSNQSTEKETLSKIVRKSPIRFRILFGFILIVLLVTSVCLRQFLPWSDYFGCYCVFPNDTFIRFPSRISVPTNCSLVVPGTSP
ncbi:unnamed protein product [Dicrocoelium dendriticum]|nr:unnamed protein product [Dicrocoelium dendriticum]